MSFKKYINTIWIYQATAAANKGLFSTWIDNPDHGIGSHVDLAKFLRSYGFVQFDYFEAGVDTDMREVSWRKTDGGMAKQLYDRAMSKRRPIINDIKQALKGKDDGRRTYIDADLSQCYPKPLMNLVWTENFKHKKGTIKKIRDNDIPHYRFYFGEVH